jgi:hypothetical protein
MCSLARSVESVACAADAQEPAWFVAAMNRTLAPLTARIDSVESVLTGVKSVLTRMAARDANSRARVRDFIVKVTNARGELPPDPFPQTPLELFEMGGPALTSLLDFYSAPVPHTIEDRRHSAFRILGLTTDGLKFD